MWIREVVFQGIFGSSRPSRIRIEKGLCHVQLPNAVDPHLFQRMLLSLLYPTMVPESELASWSNQKIRIGAVIEQGDRVYKIFRQAEESSAAIQDITRDPINLARGGAKVAVEMMGSLALPDWEDFLLLHTWDFSPREDRASPVAAASGTLPRDPEARRLVEMYQDSLAIEECDLRIENARAAMHDLKRERIDLKNSFGNVDHLERDLESLSGCANITEKERELVEQNNDRESRFRNQIDQIDRDLEDVENEYDSIGSVELKRDFLIWGTVLVAIILFVVSFVLDMRSLALINILVFGGTCFGILRRFSRVELVGKTKARLDQMQRRISMLEKDRDEHKATYRDILARTNAHDFNDFQMNIEAYHELTQQMEEFNAKAQGGDHLAKIARYDAKIDSQERAIETLVEERKGLGEYALPSYELERSLEDAGVNPHQFKQKEEPQIVAKSVPMTGTAVDITPHLAAVADKRGLLHQSLPNQRLRTTWEKLVIHLGGSNWSGVNLDEEGHFMPPLPLRKGFTEWATRRPEVARLIAGSLSAAIMASTPPANPYSRCRFLCLVDPYKGLDEGRIKRLEKVLHSLESRANILVLQ